MSAGFLNIVEDIVISRVIGNVAPVTHAHKMSVGVGLLAALAFMTGCGFLISSFYIWLKANVLPFEAALYTSFFCMGLAIILMLGLNIYHSYRRRKIEQSKEEIAEVIETAYQVIEEDFGVHIKDNPKKSILIATLAGFAAEKYI
jgi:ribose/xylose/arabinose/galactoside ABC-type transport system permease subunit